MEISRPYTSDDLLFMAQKQRQMETTAMASSNGILFCDTELINLKQWCLHKFGFCHEFIEEELSKKPYDHYLLTAPDLPWTPDPLRENPDKGEYFFQVYKKEIEHYGFSFSVVCGEGRNRRASALHSVKCFLSKKQTN
jgi:nicotinamide riboside kinase